ncbi:MAG: enoyl-CoA hydratase/isomerase family protein [Candidatus Aminicenantes bacterium]|nr:enoyl-CoA hydratase/isomerase family protein [Candidatus Aminicenantes bacterium]
MSKKTTHRFQTILVKQAGAVTSVTINRPRVMNALNNNVLADLGGFFESHQSNESTRCVLLTGAGEKAFVAGADIRELAAMDRDAGTVHATKAQRLMQEIQDFPVPVIAVINGFALGGGCELALACDIRLAATTARLGQPEINLGLIPGFGGTQRLARLVGRGKAMRLILTGAMIPAEEAMRIGLVDRVYPPEELMPAAIALANEIASKSRQALTMAKTAIHRGLDETLADGCRIEAECFGRACATTDKAEGIAAFLEKRKPRFNGE